MRPVRRLMTRLQDLPEQPPIPPSGKTPKTSGNAVIKGVKLLKQAAEDMELLLKSDPVMHADVLSALETTKPSSDGRLGRLVYVYSV